MVAYATREDLYLHGVPRGPLVRSRLVSSVDATLNRLELAGHGLALDAPVQFTVDDGGALPAPLALLTPYYAKPVSGSESLLQVAAAPGAAAIDLSSTGTFPFRIVQSTAIADRMEGELEFHSRWVDTVLTGHVVPLTAPYPLWVVGAVAKRAAASLTQGLDGMGHLQEAAKEVTRDLLRMADSGLSLRDSTATAHSNLATGASPRACTDRRVIR